MNTRAIYVFFVVLFAAFSAWPCGAHYGVSYFYDGTRNFHELPNTFFHSEYIILFNIPPEVSSTGMAEHKRNSRQRVIEADINDLKDALGDHPNAKDILKGYSSLRRALNEHVDYVEHQNSMRYDSDLFTMIFDTKPFEDVLSEIPEEFALYVRGAAAFQSYQWEDAIEYFSAVLELSSEHRKNRSVWAAFMLGKTFIRTEQYAEAVSFFEKTRELSNAGYHDSVETIEASWGWQGRAHYLAKEYLQALHAYVEQQKISKNWRSISQSIRTIFRSLYKNQETLRDLAPDELLRCLYTVHSISEGYPDAIDKFWLEINLELVKEGLYAGADQLAWLAYQCGNMDSAEQWLQHSPTESPYALYVKAKMLIREGNTEEGISILQKLADMPHNEIWRFEITHDWNYSRQPSEVFIEDIAGAFLQRDNYSDALKTFIIVDDWLDAAFLAHRIMTITELKEFILKCENDDAFLDFSDVRLKPRRQSMDWLGEFPIIREIENKSIVMNDLKSILATRLARLDRWREASPLYPKQRIRYWFEPIPHDVPSLTKRALAIAEHLEQTKNPRLSKRQQALHYFEAAKIIYDDGPNLLGIEKSFDGRQCLFPYYDWNDMDNFTRVAQERFEKTKVMPAIYSQYRYKAANLMKQCADLLPNNDPLAAEALYLGGTYLKKYDPEAADPFYKALVWRNPNLLIARQADELRWFPKEFTDVVLYTPRVKPLLPRKRTLALWFAGSTMTICAGVLLVALVKKKGKRTRTIVEDDMQPLK